MSPETLNEIKTNLRILIKRERRRNPNGSSRARRLARQLRDLDWNQ